MLISRNNVAYSKYFGKTASNKTEKNPKKQNSTKYEIFKFF